MADDTAALDWWKTVAAMDRSELIESLDSEQKLRHKLALKVPKLEQKIKELGLQISKLKDERPPYMYFVAQSPSHAAYAQRRMGISPNRSKFIITDAPYHDGLRGARIKSEHVRLVRGWKKGKHWQEVVTTMAPTLYDSDRQVGWDALAYAPDPHIDRLEEFGHIEDYMRDAQDRHVERTSPTYVFPPGAIT